MSVMPNKRLNECLFKSIIFLLVISAVVAGLFFYCFRMPGNSYTRQLPVADEALQLLNTRLAEHVWFLSEEIGERHYLKMASLNKAADYIEEQFKAAVYIPLSQIFGEKQYRNIVVDLYGGQRRDEIIVVGAHYDSVWMTPGADDNASAVAALLEIARALKNKKLSRTIRFIAFANEELPFYGTDEMGSRQAAKRSYDRNEHIVGMFSLEMLGYYSDEPDSQRYPRPLSYFYPDKANFIAFVSNLVSRGWLAESILAFRQRAEFPSEGLAVPEWLVPDIRRSDNAAFWEYGYPAIMITDTSNYRNRNYHNVGDVYHTLDYDRMARLVSGLTKMLETLAR